MTKLARIFALCAFLSVASVALADEVVFPPDPWEDETSTAVFPPDPWE